MPNQALRSLLDSEAEADEEPDDDKGGANEAAAPDEAGAPCGKTKLRRGRLVKGPGPAAARTLDLRTTQAAGWRAWSARGGTPATRPLGLDAMGLLTAMGLATTKLDLRSTQAAGWRAWSARGGHTGHTPSGLNRCLSESRCRERPALQVSSDGSGAAAKNYVPY